MVAGTSGATPGSGATDDEGEFRLKLLQAPRNTARADMVERLAIVRAYPRLTMAFPRKKDRGRIP
jgi:hypothetical protein